MRKFIVSPPALRLLAYLCIACTNLFVSCDSFEKDSISSENEVVINKKDFYTLPNSSTVIDLKSIIKAYSNVTLTITDEPQHGNLTKIGESIFNYRPHANFTKGQDYFGIEISKQGKVLLSDSIFINVDSDTTNFPCTLVAVEDQIVYYNSPSPGSNAMRVWILENDRLCGVSKEDVIITMVSAPKHGIASVTSPQHIVYEADVQYVGYDQFVYRISSPTDSTVFSYGLVNIFVSSGSCMPTASDDQLSINYDAAYKDFNLFFNDSLCQQGGMTDSIIIIKHPKGSITRINGGVIRYTPPSVGVTAVDTLVYQICFLGDCDQAMATIEINYDGCTVAANDDYAVLSDSSSLRNALTFPLDNDVMCGYQNSFEIVKQPKHGWAGIFGLRLDYTAESDTSPPDTVRYKVCNDHGCSEANFIILRE
jgi:hypothetical protein